MWTISKDANANKTNFVKDLKYRLLRIKKKTNKYICAFKYVTNLNIIKYQLNIFVLVCCQPHPHSNFKNLHSSYNEKMCWEQGWYVISVFEFCCFGLSICFLFSYLHKEQIG